MTDPDASIVVAVLVLLGSESAHHGDRSVIMADTNIHNRCSEF